MPARKITALRIWLALAVGSCAALSLACRAARRVPVFLVDVSGQSAPALQQAMRRALVRATGRPGSATDPAFAALVAQAPKYVAGYQRGAQGQLQVAFNGAAVDRVITAVGRSVWNADRPFTLVVLSPMPDQADFDADHTALEQAAEARGLPISIMPLPVTDASGQLLPHDRLLALVHRYGAEQLLVGEPPAAPANAPSVPGATPPGMAGLTGAAAAPAVQPSAGPPSAPAGGKAGPLAAGSPAPGAAAQAAAAEWQWTLVTPFMRRRFSGALTTGIDATVDLLAPPPALAADRTVTVALRIEGVSNLTDYAHVEMMLAAMPGVSRADVREVHGNTAVFSLQAHGGAATVVRLLAGAPHFSPTQAAGGLLAYRYLPALPPVPAAAAGTPAEAAAH